MASPTHFDPQVLRGKDSFFTGVYRFFDDLRKHKGALIALVAIVIAAGVIGSIYAGKKQAKSEEGKNALFLAQKTYLEEMKALAGVKAPAPLPAAPADEKDEKAKKAREAAEKARREEETASAKKLDELSYQKFDVDSKLPETTQKFKGVIDQYPGTRAAYEARMALGELYFNHGEPTKSAEVLKAAADAAPNQFEKAVSLSALGYAQENAGKCAEAIPTYEKALKLGEGGIKGDLLLSVARCQAQLKDTAKARSTYDQIITQLPNTDAAKTAETLKARLQ